MSTPIIFISEDINQDICPSCATYDPAVIGYSHPDGDTEFMGEVELFQQKLNPSKFVVEARDMVSQVQICRNADCRAVIVVTQSDAILEADSFVQLNLK